MLGRLWTKFLLFICSALLVGCYSLRPESRPVNKEERTVVAATLNSWEAHGLPSMKESCKLQLGRWRVALVEGESLDNLCSARGRQVSSCFIGDNEGFVLAPRAHPTAVVRSTLERKKQLASVRHETLHWLSWCGGLGLDWGHKDENVWRLDK